MRKQVTGQQSALANFIECLIIRP